MPIPMISGPYKTFRDLNPGETYIEYEGSTITIPIRAKLRGGAEIEERLKLSAFMRLEVFPAYVNQLGTREFQFFIRDWELYGYSPLLNELFMGHPHGYLEKGVDPREGREIAVMTFTLSHHYEKFQDEKDELLAPASRLVIDDVTSHDMHNNDIFWEIVPDSLHVGRFIVYFHKKPPTEKGVAPFSYIDDFEHLVAVAENVDGGQPFKAQLVQGRTPVPALGNTVLAPGMRLRTPLSIQWALGPKPRPSRGHIHIITPARSICVADQGPDLGHPIDSADFPARITYAASYHVYVNDTPFVVDQAGVAIADGVHEIPPVDVRVAFEKPFQGKFFSFAAGTCTGMHEITEAQYRQGKALSNFFRSVRLDTQRGSRPPAAPIIA